MSTPISRLPATTCLTPSDTTLVVQNGVTKQIPAGTFASGLTGISNSKYESTFTTVNSNSASWINNSYVEGSGFNTSTPATVSVANNSVSIGSNNTSAVSNAILIGCGLTAPQSNYTYVNNLSTPGIINVREINMQPGGCIIGNVTIAGGLTALSGAQFVNTIFTTTSALSIVNTGAGPSLFVRQVNLGVGDIASFYDASGDEALHIGNDGFVGIFSSIANERLTVNGNISSNAVIYDSNSCSTSWSSAYTTTNANSGRWNTPPQSFVSYREDSTFSPNTSATNLVSTSSVAIGMCNTACGSNSIVLGVRSSANAASNCSNIGGGCGHIMSNAFSTIAGGANNVQSGTGSTIAGGINNNAGVNGYTVIGGGFTNAVTGDYATVGGGRQNTASGYYSTVGGGCFNTSSHTGAVVTGGGSNNASFCYSTVGGGRQNTASGYHSTVGGGCLNRSTNTGSTIAGGISSQATGVCSFVGGGGCNISAGIGAVVTGGRLNTASGNYSTVGGGCFNRSIVAGSTVSGGISSQATGLCATAGGGFCNTVGGTGATVGGGRGNTTSNTYATIAGGNTNNISGVGASIGGGSLNIAIAGCSTIPGGRGAYAYLLGQQAYGSGFFSTTGDAQAVTYVMRQSSTNVAQCVCLALDGISSYIDLANCKSINVNAYIIGLSTSPTVATAPVVASFNRTATIRYTTSTGAVIPTGGVQLIGADIRDSLATTNNWYATLSTNGRSLMAVASAGTAPLAGSPIRWTAAITGVEVGF